MAPTTAPAPGERASAAASTPSPFWNTASVVLGPTAADTSTALVAFVASTTTSGVPTSDSEVATPNDPGRRSRSPSTDSSCSPPARSPSAPDRTTKVRS
jgi:hypothetical protein